MPEPDALTIEDLGERHFAFFPAIANIPHNEWVVRESKWSEVLVANCRTGEEIWIPRRYIGEIAAVEDPITIVGLTKPLEYKAGAVWPHERRVVKMPQATAPSRASSTAQGGEVKPPSFMESLKAGPELKVGKLVAGVVAGGLLVLLIIVGITFRPVRFKGIEQYDLALTGEDDYHAVVRRLGPPTEDRWREATGEMQYRLLHYKDKGFTVILMGTDRDTARYIGAINEQGKPVHSVRLPTGGDTLPLLRRLPKP
jgi:hypothetical protein